jgi:RHS repeat-associated protein
VLDASFHDSAIYAYDAVATVYDGGAQCVLLEHKFTGKERDSESGLDNFGARYDSSSMGRFMTPDPLLNSGRPWEGRVARP